MRPWEVSSSRPLRIHCSPGMYIVGTVRVSTKVLMVGCEMIECGGPDKAIKARPKPNTVMWTVLLTIKETYNVKTIHYTYYMFYAIVFTISVYLCAFACVCVCVSMDAVISVQPNRAPGCREHHRPQCNQYQYAIKQQGPHPVMAFSRAAKPQYAGNTPPSSCNRHPERKTRSTDALQSSAGAEWKTLPISWQFFTALMIVCVAFGVTVEWYHGNVVWHPPLCHPYWMSWIPLLVATEIQKRTIGQDQRRVDL